MTKFNKIMVELEDGEVVCIADLPKMKYEDFLELMVKLNLGYNLIQSKRMTNDTVIGDLICGSDELV